VCVSGTWRCACTVLRGMDAAVMRGAKPDELRKKMEELAAKHLVPAAEEGEDAVAATARKDVTSHHILRLAFCGTEDKRRWFLGQEVALFRWRLEEQKDPLAVSRIMSQQGFEYPVCTDEERRQWLADLLSVAQSGAALSGVGGGGGDGGAGSMSSLMRSEFFKVPFIDALDLVRSRRVLLRGGMAIVPAPDMKAIVVGRYRAKLSRALAVAARALPAVLTDERLGPLLGNMSMAHLGPDWGGAGSAVGDSERLRPAEVESAARASFPLCMQTMTVHVQKEHHLKHWGRLQLGLFLKGCGMSVEEALHWWQSEFTQRMSGEEFVKKYAYNIRHMYGKEGKRTEYTPYACMKIITGTAPGAGEVHGCPYRHWDAGHVRTWLSSKLGLAGATLEDIMESVRTRDFQIACRKEFKARHGVMIEEVGEHPNTYFIESRKLLLARAGGGAAAGGGSATAPAPAFSATSSSSSSSSSSPPPADAAATAPAADDE